MSQSDSSNQRPYIPIIVALIGLIGAIGAAVIPQLNREPSEPFIELTVQAIQFDNTSTAQAQQPTITQSATASATLTLSAVQVTDVPSATPSQTASSVPTEECTATVRSNSNSTILNIVKESPSFSSRTIGSVNRDERLIVVEKSTGSDVYYRVQRDSKQLGWIAAEYLVLPPNCF